MAEVIAVNRYVLQDADAFDRAVAALVFAAAHRGLEVVVDADFELALADELRERLGNVECFGR